jgi:hypothetical protein
MTNADTYHFADFTRNNYRRLVKLAKEHYVNRTYDDYVDGERFVIWRHDVDFSPQAAVKMARIEAEEGIKATYFLLLHSQFYNALERDVTDCFRTIIGLGHDIGLHFDSTYYSLVEEADIEKPLQLEKTIIETILACEVRTFCFHITTPFAVRCTQSSYAGLQNANSEFFRHRVGYCSDSNGYWRFRRLEDVLREAGDLCLQVLTHPEMWQDTIMSPRERVMRCISGRADMSRCWYDTILAENGRKNIDWE